MTYLLIAIVALTALATVLTLTLADAARSRSQRDHAHAILKLAAARADAATREAKRPATEDEATYLREALDHDQKGLPGFFAGYVDLKD